MKTDAAPVSEFRYKAYISYSHQDEAWAKWLHTALESYRIPRRLVGQAGYSGDIPARINPVFRDREDLSAARNLSKRITEALEESESLIIICSPGAAQSRWVNEEIRKFRTTPQGKRIFCLIVDGDPGGEPAGQGCFPPALFEGMEQQHFEPLAADVRKWADGKQLAKLKLVAGMLGIRLDELRQRDLQRRRKARAFAGLGAAAVIALLILTLVSQVSRQHQRDIAEQMASFIVDLGEKLQSETDLETLALISSEASKHFQNLDPDNLTPETGKRVALTLRQVGRVSQLQGKPEEALQAFLQSRDLLSDLSNRSPELSDLLFELGNAEFYIGAFYSEQGDYSHTRAAFEKNHEITGALLEIDPENPDWLLERSYTHANLAAVQLKSGTGVDEASLMHLQEAIELIEKLMQLMPDETTYASQYSIALSWAADAQTQACNLENAMTLREKALRVAENLARSDPGDNNLKRRYAYAVSGVAAIQTKLGRLNLAEQNLGLAIEILEQMSAADPSNVLYPQEAAHRQLRLARLMANTGRLEEARSLMSGVGHKIGGGDGAAYQNEEARQARIDFEMTLARILYLSGNRADASLQLQKALELQLAVSEPVNEKLHEMRFQWWEMNGEEGLAQFLVDSEPAPAVNGALRSCADALGSAKESIIEGDYERAVEPVRFLQERGYAEPAFIEFCTKYGLCPGQPVKS